MGNAGRWLCALFGGKSKSNKEKRTSGVPVKSFTQKDDIGNFDLYKEEEQNKRAIAVAAATAAVAEAAVAAAQAAAAVVRLTSSGRVVVGYGGNRSEHAAAVKIQSAFRAYLARRALRALKGLVKLQAIVRGNIVRKQAAETLRCMHALVRVQARARACRALKSDRDHLNSRSRNHPVPVTPEKSEQSGRSNTNRSRTSSPLKRNASKKTNSSSEATSGLRWLDTWIEERYMDTKNHRTTNLPYIDDEKNAKILEIDTVKTNYTSKRKTNHQDSFDSYIPSPVSIDTQHTQTPIGFPVIDAIDFVDSPQFFSVASSRRGHFSNSAKSECSKSLFSGYSDCPNYMANTESSNAKARSQSAPKQRASYYEKSRLGRNMSSCGSSHGVRQRSNLNKGYAGSGRLDRNGVPLRN